MNDEALVRLFEEGVAPPDGFHHADHVRVACWYLRGRALPCALNDFSVALRNFATKQGKPDLYHETITIAFLLVISERLDRTGRDATWLEFAERNPDLLTWRPSVLDRYYLEETLRSDRAKRTFVMPDRLAAC